MLDNAAVRSALTSPIYVVQESMLNGSFGPLWYMEADITQIRENQINGVILSPELGRHQFVALSQGFDPSTSIFEINVEEDVAASDDGERKAIDFALEPEPDIDTPYLVQGAADPNVNRSRITVQLEGEPSTATYALIHGERGLGVAFRMRRFYPNGIRGGGSSVTVDYELSRKDFKAGFEGLDISDRALRRLWPNSLADVTFVALPSQGDRVLIINP